MRPVRLHTAAVSLGLCTCHLLAQSPATGPTAPAATTQAQVQPISPATRQVPAGMLYHHVYIVSPLIGSGKPGDPKRPFLVPTPPARPSKPGTLPSAVAAKPAADVSQTGLLSFQMQLSDDGKYALAELVFATPLAFQNALKTEVAARNISAALPPNLAPAAASASLASALQTAVPGLQIFERGVATQAQILAAFQQKKAGFSVASIGVRGQ